MFETSVEQIVLLFDSRMKELEPEAALSEHIVVTETTQKVLSNVM